MNNCGIIFENVYFFGIIFKELFEKVIKFAENVGYFMGFKVKLWKVLM